MVDQLNFSWFPLQLEDPSLKSVAVEVVLTIPDPPPQLLSAVLAKLEGLASLVEGNSARSRIPKGTLAKLLVHDDTKIAAAAALGEWRTEPEGDVRSDLLPTWRTAILKAQDDKYQLGQVLKTDPALAHDWLRRQVEEVPSVRLTPGHAATEAVSVLEREQRLSVLRAVNPGSTYNSLVSLLVGDDLDLYRRYLEGGGSTSAHLRPLHGRPTGLWPEKAKLALAVGFSAEEVAYAAYSGVISWNGSESAMWNEWAEQFAELCTHEDAGVRDVAEIGRAYAQHRRDEAIEKEQLEAIYGRF